MKKVFALLSMLLLALNFCACHDSDNEDSGGSDLTPYAVYSIQGTVTVNGVGLANATIELSGTENHTTTTDNNGIYTFSDLEPGDYIIKPSTAAGYVFTPESISLSIGATDVASQDFSAVQFRAAVYLHYTLPDQYNYQLNGGLVADEAGALFSDYALTDGIEYSSTETVSGYALEQFIDAEIVAAATPDPDSVIGNNDPRELYAVVVRCNQDGFSNRTKFVGNGLYNPDLRWETFEIGYLLDLNYTGKTFFPASLGLVKMYNTKFAYDLYLFRKIDVKRPDAAGTIVTFEPQATTADYVDDTLFTKTTSLTTTKFSVELKSFGDYQNVKSISLDQFITEYVTDNPSGYAYRIVALDGTSKEGWTYAQMQQAVYLPDLDFIVQLDASNAIVNGTQIHYPVRIELVTSDGQPVEYNYAVADPPAYAKAYDE